MTKPIKVMRKGSHSILVLQGTSLLSQRRVGDTLISFHFPNTQRLKGFCPLSIVIDMVSSSSSAVSLIRSSSPCNPLLQLPRNLLPLLLRRATHFPAVAQPASPPPHNPLPQLSISFVFRA
ncbi:uncharacterized protein LOC130940893 isoform X2 [Arachis stenosperma]|uniref:uncharacterized protein LOC130940893 isoform X2 n=1 Tax=Arachis stenosperma TaxID=217475 RepID=UPI0025AD6DE4|nr:uncharacterized protein LOC130940893 isoform X2 [Arachis stenosperma]